MIFRFQICHFSAMEQDEALALPARRTPLLDNVARVQADLASNMAAVRQAQEHAPPTTLMNLSARPDRSFSLRFDGQNALSFSSSVSIARRSDRRRSTGVTRGIRPTSTSKKSPFDLFFHLSLTRTIVSMPLGSATARFHRRRRSEDQFTSTGRTDL